MKVGKILNELNRYKRKIPVCFRDSDGNIFEIRQITISDATKHKIAIILEERSWC